MNDWNNISDDEFDAILRKSAENLQPDFDEAAWKDMSEKLDRGIDPSPKGNSLSNIFRKASYGFLALLFVSSVYWIVKKSNQDDVQNALSDVTKPGSESLPAVGSKRSERDSLKADGQRTLPGNEDPHSGNLTGNEEGRKAISTGAQSVEADKRKETELPFVAGRASELNTKQKSAGTRSNERSSADETTHSSGTSVENGGKAENAIFPAVSKYSAGTVRKTENADPDKISKTAGKNINTQNSREEFLSRSAKPVNSNAETSVPEMTEEAFQKTITLDIETLKPKDAGYDALLPEAVMDSPKLKNTYFPPTTGVGDPEPERFGLRIIYSPDFTTISNNKIFRIGNNIGIVGEYRINSRWSVQTGVIRSLKYYGAKPEQYKTPYYVIKPGNPLKDISAICNMLDIPVNLMYDFNSNSYKNRWFASAGVTNYLMIKEKYNYSFENNSDPAIKYRSWEGKTGFYPLGVLNLSGGYERRITRKLSVQGEPFFKVPLKNVGYGKVKLITIGVFLSARIGI